MALPPAPPAPPAEQVPPAPVGPQRDANNLRASLCFKPSDAPLAQAIGRSGMEQAEVDVTVTFGADGTITDANVTRSSRNRDIDRAALQWARRAKLCPGAPGQGRIPFRLRAG
jgi:protein TonB